MVAIPFPTSSTPGARPGEGAGRLVNVYAFKEGTEIAYGSVPGLTPFATVGATPRGSLALTTSTLYTATKDILHKVTSAGTVADIGPLQGSGLVTMARNNKAPSPDVVIVTENGAFTTDGLSVSDYADADVGNPNSVSFLDGYFLFTYGDATIRASNLNTTALNSESFTKAEARPDGLLRGIVKGRQFIALGPSSTEFYDNAGTAPFPLSRSEVVDTGLFGPWAVAGFEDGWDKAWLMVASDGTVRRWDGYTPTVVSTRDVERSISTVTDSTKLTALVYTFGGNSVFSLSGPGFTWDYHLNIGEWFERESYQSPRWRGQTSVKAFGKWLVGDLSSTSLMAINENARKEGSQPLICIGEGYLPSFPNGARVGGLTMNFSTGQGNNQIVASEVLLSWSFDGNGHFSTPLVRSLGQQGEYARAVTVTSLGRARGKGVRLRWEVSAPFPFTFRGADLGRTSPRKI